jgi:hypothetical protein
MLKHAIAVAASCLFLAACDPQTSTAETKQQERTDQLLNQSNSQVGIANVTNFTEKALANKIIELRDHPKLATWTYTQGIDGRLICLGASIGFGLPYATQTTNPQKFTKQDCGERYCDQPTPQAEPNGLYMPGSADATWVMLINPETGEPVPTYVEPRITVSTFKLTGAGVSAPCK